MRIEARDIHIRYGEREALAGVSCDLRPGEMVGLIGPNGAGKTTLVRALAGLVKPSSGEIGYDGRSLQQTGRAELARRLAYLAQGGSADWPLSVEAIVGLGRLPHRRPFSPPSEADRKAIARALTSAELTDLGGRTLANCRAASRRARCSRARSPSRPSGCSPMNPSPRSIRFINCARCRCCAPKPRAAPAWSPCCTT